MNSRATFCHCLFLVIVTLLAGPAPEQAQAASQKIPLPESFDRAAVDAYIESAVQQRGVAGLSVAIVHNGEIVLAKGYGNRSLVPKAAVEPGTRFWIGSVTKQFTCACILLLQEQGKLSVQDKVAKYYPDLTRAKEITLLDLMNHVSGYPDYYPLDFVDRRMSQPIEPDTLIHRYATGPLDFEPGTRYSYSNTGYIILGRVVERVSGQPMGTFLNEFIFKPLGMNDTLYEPSLKAPDTRYATGHASFALNPAEAIAPEAPHWLAGAGGICSTAADLARWDLALMTGKLLKPESYRTFTTARDLPDGRNTGYGCGVGVGIRNGRTVITHSGAVSGFNAWNGMIPSLKSAVVMLCNQESGLGSLPSDVLGLLLKEESNIPKVAGLPAIEAAKVLLSQWQQGKVDRSILGDEFNYFLTEDKLRAAEKSLKPLGTPVRSEITRSWERGGMEVSDVHFTFESGAASALLYRTPDGKVQQFLMWKE